MTPEEVLDHIRYTGWASRKLLDAVRDLSPHRGRVVALIRQAGVQPPNTDLVYYYREAAAK